MKMIWKQKYVNIFLKLLQVFCKEIMAYLGYVNQHQCTYTFFEVLVPTKTSLAVESERVIKYIFISKNNLSSITDDKPETC